MKTKIIILLLSTSIQSFASDESEAYGFTDGDNVIISQNRVKPSNSEQEQLNRGVAGSYYHYGIQGTNFTGRRSTFNGESPGGEGGRNCVDGSIEHFLDHEIKLEKPTDKLAGVRVWVDDTDVGEDLGIIMYRSCFPGYAAGNGVFSDFFFSDSLATSAGEYSEFFVTDATFEGLETECKIMARVRFGSPSTCNGIEDVVLLKFRVEVMRDELIFKENFSEF